jgi:class 3 adenylate cyclase
MKFGLHIGWAIEGPVGSLHKVDATYLSPHVNIAARCATAAKQWNVDVRRNFLFALSLSHSLASLLCYLKPDSNSIFFL